ncbi:MAG: hypothetical protein V4864_01895 [Pseudomonadota bacterium]
MPISKPSKLSKLNLSRLAAACLAAAMALPAIAAPKTVCTITINSPDEKDTFRRFLPPGEYNFVELVERGRPDWLASACQQRVACDSLIVSGHFDGGTEFYTDRLDQSEYLTVEEMERASCSDSCPGVFAQLKEVYLFGCNTLKPEPGQTPAAEVLRSLLRAGNQPAEAMRLAGLLGEQHAESNRDRMRHIFKDVPVIYGFSSKAPLGRYAGPLLDRYFETAPAGEIGSGRTSSKLLALFAPSSMTVTNGLTAAEPQARLRADACRFLDTRLTDLQKVEFMHQVLRRNMAEVRMFMGHLERYMASIGPVQRTKPETAAAFAAIAADATARDRYMIVARDAEEAAASVRMMALARGIGWLTPGQEHAEFMRMLGDRIRRDAVGTDEVDLACARGRADNDPALRPLADAALKSGKVTSAAAAACLGSTDAHARVLRALTSAKAEDVAVAQAYLRHRPLADVGELRAAALAIGRMPTGDAQVRALETLAQQRVADADSLREVVRLFPRARSLQVQRAIAGVLIRADHRLLGQPDLAQSLRQHRLKSPDGEDVIDALIRVLQAG